MSIYLKIITDFLYSVFFSAGVVVASEKNVNLKGQSYYFEPRLKILLRTLFYIVYHETLISTFSSELRQKLTYDLVSFKSDPVSFKSDPAKINEDPQE